MFDYVTIRVTAHAASEAFYDTVLATLGIERTASDDTFIEWGDFSLAAATADRTATRRLHAGFAAPSREHVDASGARARPPGTAMTARANSVEVVNHRRPSS